MVGRPTSDHSKSFWKWKMERLLAKLFSSLKFPSKTSLPKKLPSKMQNPNDTYKIRRTSLLGRLKANALSHRKTFELAIAGYRKRAIEELDRNLEDAKAGKKIVHFIQLAEPEDHTTDYESIIDLFEMVEGDFVELSFKDFLRYVRDQWDWSGQFTETTSFYTQSR